MTVDPYKNQMFKSNPYAKKRDIAGKLCVILDGKLEGRGLELIKPISRAVLSGEIHELIVTDQGEAAPGAKVDRIAYIGFFEVTQGGVIVEGDQVFCEDKLLGEIAGFDETHCPNHWNIIIRHNSRESGLNQGLSLEETIWIKKVRD